MNLNGYIKQLFSLKDLNYSFLINKKYLHNTFKIFVNSPFYNFYLKNLNSKNFLNLNYFNSFSDLLKILTITDFSFFVELNNFKKNFLNLLTK